MRFTALALLTAFAAATLSAGPLDPPAGPVQPTGKTIQEAEPRIAVNAENTPGDADSVYKITAPGSYYLTGNVTGIAGFNGIEIDAGEVTLDLNGYTVRGVTDSLNGIHMQSFRDNVVIRNGIVRNWSLSGINGRIDSGRIENITATFNGAWGIDNNAGGSYSTVITDCEAANNGAIIAVGGIRASDVALVRNCVSLRNGGTGIIVGATSRVLDCVVSGNEGNGIHAGSDTLITGCTVAGNRSHGIAVNSDCVVASNNCGGNGAGDFGAGVYVIGGGSRIEGNTCTDADRGIIVDSSGNAIIRNVCSGNSLNWQVAAGNVCLVVQAATSAAITGNAGGVSPGSTDPNANFTY